MAQSVPLLTPKQEKEARLVAGMTGEGEDTQYELYAYCSDYFWDNYRGVFFATEEVATEIFQNAFITLWENIERRKICVRCGQVTAGGLPLRGSLLTYFMSIAHIKFLEYGRQRPVCPVPMDDDDTRLRLKELCAEESAGLLYSRDENAMLDIVSDLLSAMSPRCYEILTKFYYEEKNLDAILEEIPTIQSKDALKTKKHKCMESLRRSAKAIWKKYLNDDK